MTLLCNGKGLLFTTRPRYLRLKRYLILNERSSCFAPILGNGDLNANEKEKYINTDILKTR
jgi:hypothetical protein